MYGSRSAGRPAGGGLKLIRGRRDLAEWTPRPGGPTSPQMPPSPSFAHAISIGMWPPGACLIIRGVAEPRPSPNAAGSTSRPRLVASGGDSSPRTRLPSVQGGPPGQPARAAAGDTGRRAGRPAIHRRGERRRMGPSSGPAGPPVQPLRDRLEGPDAVVHDDAAGTSDRSGPGLRADIMSGKLRRGAEWPGRSTRPGRTLGGTPRPRHRSAGERAEHRPRPSDDGAGWVGRWPPGACPKQEIRAKPS